MRFFTILLLFIVCNTYRIVAQHITSENQYSQALALFEKQNYDAAKPLFEKYIAQKEEDRNEMTIINANCCLILCALYLKSPDFEVWIDEVIENYPNHAFVIDTYRKIGAYFFLQNNYNQAIRYLKKLNLSKPNKQNLTAIYQLAYSHFDNKNYKEASQYFNLIKGGEHEYAYLSSYYAGYLAFLRGEYATALTDISKAVEDKNVKQKAEQLLVLLYYKQKRYKETIDYILKNKKGEEAAFDLLLADSYLMQGDSAIALSYFEKHIKQSKEQIDRDLYYKVATAYACAYVNKLVLSAYYFSKVADAEDSLAQLGAYQLGVISVRLKDKASAIYAFDKCRKLSFDKNLQKSAAFNYIKLNFETDNAKNALEGCTFYEKKFPKDDNWATINVMRSEAYLNTSHLVTAMQYIEQMQFKDAKAQLAYQRITFNRAVELFNNKEYRQSRNVLTKSLIYPHNAELVNASYFLFGEIFIQLHQPDTALRYYQQVAKDTKYSNEADFGIANAYFMVNDYENAIRYLQKYIQLPNSAQLIEAHTKLGDAFFKQKNYSNALANYELALQSGSLDFPYNYYQRALCLIELRRFSDAEDLLEHFEIRYPTNLLIDWVHFQRAILHYQNAQKNLALNVLSQIIDKETATKILPYALLKRGDIYVENAVINRAVNDYKTVIEDFPATEPAEQAQKKLEELQMRGINIPNYNYLIGRNIRPKSANPLTQEFELNNARNYFEHGDYKHAASTLYKFLQGAPKSEMTSEAEFLLGLCHQNLGDLEKASTFFERSESKKGFLKSASIDLQIGFYQNAINKYDKVLKDYAEEGESTEAKIGMVKAYFELKNNEKVMYYLDELKNNPVSQPVVNLYFGKIYLAEGQYEEAVLAFGKVVEATTEVYAAEAQYLIGLVYRQQASYLMANEELQKVKEKYQVHTAWVYESLFLIAENYISLDNSFQAKAVIQWIIDNSPEIKIVYRAKEKLKEWDD
jgi:tetratricopeptide (TPR) repeat protein